MARRQNNMVNEDFKVLNEDFSRWILKDGTIIQAKFTLQKIFFTSKKEFDGYPDDYEIRVKEIVSTIIPGKLKNLPQNQPHDLNEEIGEEVKIEDIGKKVKIKEMHIQEQSYMTLSGFKLRILPILEDVHKLNDDDLNGNPVYAAKLEPITKLE